MNTTERWRLAAPLLALVAWTVLPLRSPGQEVAPPTKETVPTPPPDPVAGGRVFEGHCALCHGIDGRGGRGPGLNRPDLSHAPDDERLKSVIEDGISPEMPATWFLTPAELANLMAYVRSLGKVAPEPLRGDPARGAGIYASSGCAACHILGGQGTGFGPELTNVGARRSGAHLAEVLRAPASRLPENFVWVEAVTAANQAIRGIRVNEDAFTIQIKDPAGQFHSLRKQALVELRKMRGETPMPSYEQTLQPSELEDLVAYLASLRGKK